MFSKIKNILIFVVIAAALILAYIFFFKKDASQSNLTSTFGTSSLPAETQTQATMIDTEFLSILLSIKDIKLNDSMFADTAFLNLRDSSITLTPDGTEGRSNPFALIGADANTSISASVNSALSSPQTNAAVGQVGALKIQSSN